MSIFSLLVDPTGIINSLDAQTYQLNRIATVLERLIPQIVETPKQEEVPESNRPPIGYSFAETAYEYENRMMAEKEFGLSLGLAQWSPQLQQTLHQMRLDLMKARIEPNEAGEPVEVEGYSKEEADRIIKESFQFAQGYVANQALYKTEG